MKKVSDFFDLKEVLFRDLFSDEFPWAIFVNKHLETYIQAHLKPKIDGTLENGCYLADEQIFIGKGTVVESGAYIKGPTIIGENCQVRQGAYIRGNVIAGNGCVIGHATEVKNSVFLNGAKAGHFAYIGDSILGSHVNLGAGTKLANFKITTSPISLEVEGKKVLTGLRKLGAIIGDGAELGCNSVTAPGTLIGKNAMVYPCVFFRGSLPARGIAKNAAPVDLIKI